MVHVQRASEVDGDELVPLGGLGLGEGLEHVPAGVVDQHVDRAEALHHGGHGRVDAGAVGDVAAEGLGLAAVGADLRGHRFGGLEVHVEHRHAGAVLGETAAGGAADAATAAGDDHCLVLKSLHLVLLGCEGLLYRWAFGRHF
ncbi:hypothetical protein D9M69_552500 [compost metagenome]